MRNERKAVVAPAKAAVELVRSAGVTLVRVGGLVDEHFQGFGNFDATPSVVLDVSRIARMTSFGVRQWIKAMEVLSKSNAEVFLLGCPTFFVDQLNMVLNFGGASKVVTAMAPYTCPACGTESSEMIDVLAERASLAKNIPPKRGCSKCQQELEFDETPESFFAFVNKYAATSIDPETAQLLSAQNLYQFLTGATEKPPRIVKLVHGVVTYFRIIGAVGGLFRARPLLVGAEGEVVIDLAEVDRFEAIGLKEWKRLLKSLAGQVPAVTLVDVTESFLSVAGDSIALARNVAVASVLVPYTCSECGRTSPESETLLTGWPRTFADHVCSRCGGTTSARLSAEALLPLRKASTSTPPASAKLIAARDELLSRALTDANVAQAGDKATAALSSDDIVLGKYKIVRRLSAGGMAEVFLAKQVGLGGFEKAVALKRIQRKLLDNRQQAIELFLNEAKIAGRLTHPNIVQVLDVGEEAGALLMAMEYVHGRDLRKVLRKLQTAGTQFPFAEACYVIREVALALDYAYWSTDSAGERLSVVHRDVSPHNIIVGYDGTVKLLDFGVAMSSVTEHAERLVVGKWNYMSPEAMASRTVDHRSDLFSLGVILYLLLSSSLPFGGPEQMLLKKIHAREYTPLQSLSQIPNRLSTLVDRLLQFNPADRPQRGQEVANELTELMRESWMECSTAQIAAFLNKLDADEIEIGMEMPVILELARDADIQPPRPKSPTDASSSDKSPVSVTPTSTSSRYSARIDVSETLRYSQRMMATPAITVLPGPEAASNPSPNEPPIAPAVATWPTEQKHSRPSLLLIVGMLGIAAVVLYFLLVR